MFLKLYLHLIVILVTDYSTLVATCQIVLGKNKHYLLKSVTVKCNQILVESVFRSSFQ